MRLLLTPGTRRPGPRAVANAILAGTAAAMLSAGPISAQPRTGEALAQEILSACTGLTWAEEMTAAPRFVACALAIDGTVIAALPRTVADQERVGAALADLLRAPVEAGATAAYPAVAPLITASLQGLVYGYCVPGGSPETCTAVVRIGAVAAQAQVADIGAVFAQFICGALIDNPAWRPAIIAVIDGLAARAATGTDPVMQGRIDPLQAGTVTCPYPLAGFGGYRRPSLNRRARCRRLSERRDLDPAVPSVERAEPIERPVLAEAPRKDRPARDPLLDHRGGDRVRPVIAKTLIIAA